MLKKYPLFIIVIGYFITIYAQASWNNPYPTSEHQDNTLYTAFTARPKFLDPIRAYSEDEYRFLGQIYEPPLQYHYLHRPYQLIPQTLTQMPEIVFLDGQGKPLKDGHSPSDIAYTEYRLQIQKGILYQPHPAFAKDQHQQYRYHNLTEQQTQTIQSLGDLPYTGTRELTAEDYVYQIKRLAHPPLHSPIGGLMRKYIVGLEELSQQLNAAIEKQPAEPIDLRDFSISGVSAMDDGRFRIRIKGQYPQFIYWLAMPFFAPMPWEAEVFYRQPGFKKNNISLHWYPVGTGAYMLTENNPNLRMVLEKNPNFRGQTYPTTGAPGDREKGLLKDAGKPVPFIDKVVFTLEKEAIPYWNKFLQGYFDSSGISSDSFDSAVEVSVGGDVSATEKLEEKGIQLDTLVDTSIFYLGFNMLDPVVGGDSEQTRLLRQAISIAIDDEEYISIFRNGRGIVGQGPIPPGIFGYREGKEGVNPVVYRWQNGALKRRTIDEAKQLLTQAGYPEGIDSQTGQPLLLYYDSVDSGAGSKARLNWLRKQFAKLNIQLIVRSTDYNRFRDKMLTGAAQIFSWGWSADYPDAENFLFLLQSNQGKVKHRGENAANYANPEFDRLFLKMKRLPNSPERQAMIDKLVDIIRHDAPWSFRFHPTKFSLIHNWYKNVKPFPLNSTGVLKYQRVDSEQRHSLRQQWNRPILWPVLFILIAIIALIIPALIAYRRRERSRAL